MLNRPIENSKIYEKIKGKKYSKIKTTYIFCSLSTRVGLIIELLD